MEVTIINKEYKRLKSLFKEVDENKTKLVDELLNKASFIKVELDDMQAALTKDGLFQKSNKGNYRINPLYKTFLNTVNVYEGIIKTLNSIMGQSVVEADDEFDDFIKKANL